MGRTQHVGQLITGFDDKVKDFLVGANPQLTQLVEDLITYQHFPGELGHQNIFQVQFYVGKRRYSLMICEVKE